MSRNIFVTGASGFLGNNLVQELAKQYPTDTYYLLSRSASADATIKSRLSGIEPQRIIIVRGDITEPYFGMELNECRGLIQKINDFWHLAASTTFNEKDRDMIRHTNIGGTQNVIQALEGSSLDNFFYVSTAYIAGRNQGVIKEDIMPQRNGFKNSYEESKYDTELIVRATKLPFSVFRPSILIGNSKTGDSEGERRMVYGYILGLSKALPMAKKFQGEEGFWRSWKALQGKPEEQYPVIPCNLKGYSPSTKNLVPVDDAVGMITTIVKNGDVKGKTFHIVNPHDITYGEILESMSKALRVKGLNAAGDLEEPDPKNVVELLSHRHLSVFWPYILNSDPEWDTRNTRKALKDYEPVEMTPQLLDFLMERFMEDWEEENRRSRG